MIENESVNTSTVCVFLWIAQISWKWVISKLLDLLNIECNNQKGVVRTPAIVRGSGRCLQIDDLRTRKFISFVVHKT